MEDKYFADTVRFPHETIDGETVLIDSKNGHLYLFTGTGPCLWQRFIAGGTIEAVIAEAMSRYGASAEAPTRRFLTELAEVKMIRPGGSPSAAAAAAADGEWPAAFVEPAIERYDEISDIISMDPIHEVDQTAGWPRRPDPAV